MSPSLAARITASLALPDVDLRRLLPPVRMQGARPLCVPFAISAAHEAARAQLAANVEMLAVEPLWEHCLETGRAGDEGTTVQATSEALEERGQPNEGAWPYNDALDAGTEPEPAGAGHVDWFAAGALELPLAHDGVEELIETALATGFPVVLIVEVTDEFTDAAADGAIAIPPITAPIGDYHAVVVVGAATSPDGSTRRLLIRNSWGEGWGVGGYGWMPLGFLEAFVVQAAVIDPRTLFTY